MNSVKIRNLVKTLDRRISVEEDQTNRSILGTISNLLKKEFPPEESYFKIPEKKDSKPKPMDVPKKDPTKQASYFQIPSKDD